VNERLQLHPSAAPSWVVVIEHSPNNEQFATDTEAGSPSGAPKPTSDELRIYDIEGGWLTLMLDYRPAGRGTTARRWVSPAGAPASFDYNNNGFPEILAGYSSRDAWDELLPFVVDWTGSRYRLHSMTPDPPRLPTVGLSTAVVADRRIWYQKKIRLPDAVRGGASTPALTGYQIGAFAFVSSPRSDSWSDTLPGCRTARRRNSTNCDQTRSPRTTFTLNRATTETRLARRPSLSKMCMCHLTSCQITRF
jgi:hypothetical protein